MSTRRLLLVAASLGVMALAAADWPQWRGPRRDGVSAETGLLREWPKDGPKLLWRAADVGDGYSTPAVVGERIYLMSSEGLDDEYVQALGVADGKRVWRTRVGKVGNPKQVPNFPTSRSTPTVEGSVLYALGSDGDLVCLETATGKEVWHKNLRVDFGGLPGTWAYSESPLVDGNVVVCAPGGKEAAVVALDKKTGEVVWKTGRPDGGAAGYASAVVLDTPAGKEYVEFLAKGLVGVDAKTGRVRWHYGNTVGRYGMNIQTPVTQGPLVFSASDQGSGLIRIKGEADDQAVEQVYFQAKGLPTSIGGAVREGDFLYGTTGLGLVCAELATGKVRWQDKCVGPGSVCVADGRLYVFGENGQAALVEATAEGYHEKGKFTPPDPPKHRRGGMEKAWCYPVVSGGRLYLRDGSTVWCYDVKAAP